MKTLVCVAEDFYPDHVSVLWQVDEREQTVGVATDGRAERVGGKYRISSRLRVNATSWFTAGRKFTCVVRFYNGSHYINLSDEALGVKGTFESLKSQDALFVGPGLTPLSPFTLALAKDQGFRRGKYASAYLVHK